jgi:hypothetical protein
MNIYNNWDGDIEIVNGTKEELSILYDYFITRGYTTSDAETTYATEHPFLYTYQQSDVGFVSHTEALELLNEKLEKINEVFKN